MLFWVNRRNIRKLFDTEKIEAAVRKAERGTTGEIRVSASPLFWGDVRRTAERAFERLGMTASRERNGVLIFVVPSRRQFAILGDEAIHAKAGQAFWDRVSAAMEAEFRKGNFTEGLVSGIEAAGRELAAHFPAPAADNANELPDGVDFGKET